MGSFCRLEYSRGYRSPTFFMHLYSPNEKSRHSSRSACRFVRHRWRSLVSSPLPVLDMLCILSIRSCSVSRYWPVFAGSCFDQLCLVFVSLCLKLLLRSTLPFYSKTKQHMYSYGYYDSSSGGQAVVQLFSACKMI